MIACPANPQHGAHRFRLPPEGVAGPGVCAYCSVEKTFVPRRRTLWWQTPRRKAGAAQMQKYAPSGARSGQPMARVLLFTHPSSERGGEPLADIEVSRVPAVGEWLTIARDVERWSYVVRRVQHLSYTVPAQGEPLLRGTPNDRWAIDAELWVQEVRQADFFNH